MRVFFRPILRPAALLHAVLSCCNHKYRDTQCPRASYLLILLDGGTVCGLSSELAEYVSQCHASILEHAERNPVTLEVD